MYLRSIIIKRKEKTYRYWKLVESVRTKAGIRQNVIAHLGDLSKFEAEDWQELADRMGSPDMAAQLERRVKKGGKKGRPANWTIEDRVSPGESVKIKLQSIRLKEVRDFGDIYVGLYLWKLLGLGTLMQEILKEEDRTVSCDLVAAIIAVNRLCEPRSELGLVRWYPQTALPALLGIGIGAINDDRLYRTMDAVVAHKERIEKHLTDKGLELFGRDYSYLLYDLTSSYFEGQCIGNPKGKRGYSRDGRSDCLQICIGLVVDKEGFPVGYEISRGNIKDKETVLPTLDKLEKRFGPAEEKRMLCLDRGMLTEKNIKELRDRKYKYIIADRRKEVINWLSNIDEKKWEVIRKTEKGEKLVEVQEARIEGGDRILVVRSTGCGQKEKSIHGKFFSKMTERIEALQKRVAKGRLKSSVKIERKIGALLSRYPGINKWVEVKFNKKNKEITWSVKQEIKELAEEIEGLYVLRTNVTEIKTGEIWENYIRLTEIENSFRILKSDLKIRPIFHRKENRVEAHVLFSFLAYVLLWTLEYLHRSKGGTFTGRRLLEYLRQIRVGQVTMLTEKELQLKIERICEPIAEQRSILYSLGITLPKQKMKLETISLSL